MAQSTLWQENKAIWQPLLSKVNHALVYMDSPVAELLHWSGGLAGLVEAGADDAREFSSFEGAPESAPKAVFVVSSPLEGITGQIIRDVVAQSHFSYVVVMTTVSPLLHEGAGEDGEGVFEDFEEEVLGWMGNMNYTCEVLHLPVFSALICDDLFLTPTFSPLYPLATSDAKQISHQYNTKLSAKEVKSIQDLEDLECNLLPGGLQQNIKRLASGLHALLQLLGVREELYSVGATARMLASTLDDYPPARLRRKACQNRASIILLDRSLDTASALTQQTDTLMDRLMNTLPQLPGHGSDRRVDLSMLCHVHKSCADVVLPGSLACTNCSSLPTHLSPLIHKKQKEALMDVNRRLVETASSEKLPLKLSGRPGRVTAEQLDTTLALFRGKYQLISKHLDTLQTASAVSQALKKSATQSAKQDSLVALEKNLVQTVAEEHGPSGLTVLMRALLEDDQRERQERTMTLDDLLCLLTFTFSLSDGSCGEEDEIRQMKDKLVELIIRDQEDLPPITKQIVGDKVTESILPDIVDSVWEKLEAVGTERDHMKQFKSVLDSGNAMTPATLTPLLRSLMEVIVDPARPDMPDVECKSGGLGNLLRSGFGFFKSSSKPRPGDAPLLILFVIGGISAGEVRQIKEVIDKAKPGFELLIGSTRLSSQLSTLQSIFVNDNVNLTYNSLS